MSNPNARPDSLPSAAVSVRRSVTPSANALGLAPFSARSIVLSVLLGTHPPALDVGPIMALARLFDVPEGTMRTALSRMVSAGDLRNDAGRYELTGRLLERQRSQDESRQVANPSWDGTWWTVLVLAERRTVAARRAFRSDLTSLRLGELRPDAWLRPANLGPAVETRLAALRDTLLQRGPIVGAEPLDLAARLWPLEEVQAKGDRLLRAMATSADHLDGDDPAVLPEAFTISAAVVRHLRTEPQLPPQLTPPEWPAAELRSSYDRYEVGFQRLLQRFLAAN